MEEVQPGTGDDSPLRPTLACKSAGYTAEWQRKVYFTFLTSYILVIPTTIMVYCYANIIRVVWLRTSRTPDGDDETAFGVDRPRIHFVSAHKAGVATSPAVPDWRRQNNNPAGALRRVTSVQPCHSRRSEHAATSASRSRLSSKRTVVKMTLLVVVGFVFCWTPYFVVSLVRIYSDYQIQLNDALSVSEIMALGHSAVNPLLYMIYSRRAVRTFLWQIRRRVRCPSCRCSGRRSSSAACPSPPLQPHPAPPSGVHHHVTGNERDGGRGRTRRKWFMAGGGADGDEGGRYGGARSAPCHVTCSWSSSSRRTASAATDCGPHRRHRPTYVLADDKLVPVFTTAPVTSCRVNGT